MFFDNDGTFCGDANCKRTDCYRHQSNIVGNPRFLSLAMFDGTKECLKTKECTECKHILYCEGATLGMPCHKYEENENED